MAEELETKKKKSAVATKKIDPKTGKVIEKKAQSKEKNTKKKIDPKTGKVISNIKEAAKKETKPAKGKAPAKKEPTKTKKTPAAAKPKTTKKEKEKIEDFEPAGNVKPEATSSSDDKGLQNNDKGKKTFEKKSSRDLTIEPPKKAPKIIERPQPTKKKELTKEEKVLYKQLAESFSFVVNMGLVIEDRTMDRKTINDLAIGELHVIETVNKNNNKPMTLIAKKEHVTVGALTTCVNRLVQKGYLLRTRDEMDHRIILLSVTPQAKKVLKAHDKFHEDILGLVLENVNLAQATKIFNQVAYTLEVYDDPTLLEETKNTKKTNKTNKKNK